MEYEQLATLLGAYYHEDFDGVWETFELYARDASLTEMAKLSDEIANFLQTTPVDSVPAATWHLGSALWLADEPEPYVQWLEDVRSRIGDRVRAAKSA